MSATKWEIWRSPGVVMTARAKADQLNSLVSTSHTAPPHLKVAFIDLNKTLIMSKSGELHGKGETDWRWWHEAVPVKLRSLYAKGFLVVIISNQGRLTDANGEYSAEAAPFQRKMNLVLAELDIPCACLIACANDLCRKPRPGMWAVVPRLVGHVDAAISQEESFVVGDAAGRPSDHADNDRHMAMNHGIAFYTPEVFFLDQSPGIYGHHFEPSHHLAEHSGPSDSLGEISRIVSSKLSLTITIGLPGSGKSHFLQRLAAEVKILDERQYSNLESLRHTASQILGEGHSVAIDGTNISRDVRRIWIDLAALHDISIVAVYLDAGLDLCLHNDTVRALGYTWQMPQRPVYPRIPFLDMHEKLEAPSHDEGLSSLFKIGFVWNGSPEELAVWRRYWI